MILDTKNKIILVLWGGDVSLVHRFTVRDLFSVLLTNFKTKIKHYLDINSRKHKVHMSTKSLEQKKTKNIQHGLCIVRVQYYFKL